ncbi:putative RNA helicase [Trypanosoma conorhini]|uniref:Putative RNA helicase n=1 Tax=Trypanosoma conorhini TaxID=83891 RepID=A0A3R7M6N1_9TRYP|nr:putative RNA helicase [Trypanosoma conorhini]RNF27583.1 putative RNA helicase [Trypanosoma conorhini]
MRRTFVCRGGFQAPRRAAEAHDVPGAVAPRAETAEDGRPAASKATAAHKRPRVEPWPQDAPPVTAALPQAPSFPPATAAPQLRETQANGAAMDTLLFENEEELQREVEEDQRLSTDLPFTPSKTAAGASTPPFIFSQATLEGGEAEEGETNVRPDPADVVLFHSNGDAPAVVSPPTTIVGSAQTKDGGGGGVFYDLPQSAQHFFTNRRGIKQLYPWQHEVLMRDDVRGGGSLVYSLPTSGGKTLVAEISLLRCLLNRQKSCFFVLPFVSLAEEKAEGLRPFGDALGFAVDGHYGTQGRLPLPKRTTVFVCTIEKANSLLNHMLEEGLTEELGAVVVDELHMLGESHRGATLELFLSKLLCLSHAVQLIGMSATIPNLPSIATWLRAACYLGQYRPIPLRQYAVVDGMVMEDGERNERNLLAAGYATEREQLLLLATEIQEGSVLIFCASRQQCVDTARLIAQHRKGMKSGFLPASEMTLGALQTELSSFGNDANLLGQLLPHGVAFHHGGLLGEERELIERAYRQRHINVLCCTSTLAAGVNLPARRVIFKTPYVGRDFLTKSRYLQMCGRAGRAGLDEFGESFLLLSRRDCQRGQELMRKEVEVCASQMLLQASLFERALLECVSVGVIRSPANAQAWMGNLLCHHATGPFDAVYDVASKPLPVALDGILQSTMDQLIRSGLVQRVSSRPGPDEGDCAAATQRPGASAEEEVSLSATPFGACSVRSCFSVEEALLVREELENLQRTGLILADDLHLCYFLTPLREIGDCNWSAYRDVLSQMGENRQRIAHMVGVDEFFVHQRAMGLGDPYGGNASRTFATRRFFVALMLADLLSEVPMSVVEERYQCNRGQLQSLMRSASMFSSSITSFCRAMEWFSLEAVLASYVKRLGFGVKPDIVPLMELRGLQPARARALWAAGFKDPAAVAASNPEELLRRVKSANPAENKSVKFFTLRSAVRLIREANLLLQHHIREKKGELVELTLRSRASLS